jgi:hypothetical protein
MQPKDESYLKAKLLLEANHSWPGLYVFKFIVPIAEKGSLINLLGDHSIQKENPSKTGKYVSLTIEKHFQGAESVLQQYQDVKTIPGLIGL